MGSVVRNGPQSFFFSVPTQAEVRNALAEQETKQGLQAGTAAWLSSGLAIEDTQ
jgi:hypothetical protein